MDGPLLSLPPKLNNYKLKAELNLDDRRIEIDREIYF